MRRALLFLVSIAVALGAVVPYFENFENGANGWTIGFVGGSVIDWALGNPTKEGLAGAYSGNNAWATSLTGDYQGSQNSFLQSPDFDFSNVSSTVAVGFRLRYSFEADPPNYYDGLRFEYSHSNGSWTNLGAIGDSTWYTSPIEASNLPGWGGRSFNVETTFTFTGHFLPSVLNGKSLVRFRFVFTSDSTVGDLGCSIDDFQVIASVTAPQCTTVTSPAIGASVGATTTIQWSPTDGASGYDVYVGSSPNPSSYLRLGGTSGVTVASPPSTFYYQVVPNVFGLAATNCPVRSAVNPFTPVPYFNDFENGPDRWGSFGDFTPFVLGTPARSVINRAYSGNNSWVTGLTGATYNNFEVTSLHSPFFDFTLVNLNVSRVSFALWYDTESGYDGVNLQYSENGITWTTLGSVGDPTNWFTNAIIPIFGGPCWSGANNNYQIVSHVLPVTTRNKRIAFRIQFRSDSSYSDYNGAAVDDFRIESFPPSLPVCATFSAPTNASTILNPSQLSWTSSDPETFGFRVFYSTDPTFTGVPGIDVGLATSYNLPFLESGTYYWKIVPYGGSGQAVNCTYRSFIVPSEVTAGFPYFQDFELGPAGWQGRAIGSNGFTTWVLGTANKGTVRGTGSGVNAWVSGNLTSTYSNNEISCVLSPVFNFTALATDPVFSLKITYKFEPLYDGAIVQVSTTAFTWRTVGNITSGGVNWYNNSISAVSSAGFGPVAWGNTSASWITASHRLTGTAGLITRIRVVLVTDVSNVDEGFAFDDVAITAYVPPPTSAPTMPATSNQPTSVATMPATSNQPTSAATMPATSNQPSDPTSPSAPLTSAPTISNPATQPITRPGTSDNAISASSRLSVAMVSLVILAVALF